MVEELARGFIDEEGVTAVAVGKKLKLDRSAARRRLVDAMIAGLVVNLETRKGHPGKYRTTAESVDAEEMLPTPEALAEMFGPGGPLPPVPPCHPNGLGNTEQQPSGGANGGTGICHRGEPQVVAKPPATDVATAETPVELQKTEGRWHGGSGGNGIGSEKVADPDDPSTYLGNDAESDPYDIPLPTGFDRRRSAMVNDSTE